MKSKSAPDDQPAEPEAERLYNRYCKGCHGKQGDLRFNGATNLQESILSEAEAALVIAEGRGKMASYETVLSETEIWLLAEFVNGLRKN
jgi:mono/diheme cytochrome c family protein